MKQLLKMDDLSKKEIQEILNLADQLKYEKNNNIAHPILNGKTVGLLYTQPSGRSFLSFCTAINDLGGTLLELNIKDIESWGQEPLADSVRFLCRYLDCMVLRDFSQDLEEDIAGLSSVPVINAFSQSSHPCQALAALMTIREKKGVFHNRKLSIIGAEGPLPWSLVSGAQKMGMDVCLCCPENLIPKDNQGYTHTLQPQNAVKNADVIYVCPYTRPSQYNTNLKSFQVNKELMSYAKEDVLVLHPLPAIREYEIDSYTFESHCEEIFDQAENRLHVQKSVLVLCMKGSE